jgi:rfaE bifunctional protein kinase chain/domain
LEYRERSPAEIDRAVRFGSLIRAFQGRRVGVIGDLVADLYLYCRPARLSREAPVLIVRHEREEFLLGGAANTIANLRMLGADVSAVGMVGEDRTGERLEEALRAIGTDTVGVIRSARWRTIAKHRVLAGDYHTRKQQVLRIDHEPERRPEPADSARLVEMVERLSDWADAWIISDYGYHLISEEVLERLRGERRKGKVVVADSRYRLRDLRGITLVTPNETEAFAAFGIDQVFDEGKSEEVVVSLGRRILEDLGVAAALVTRGDQGMMLFEHGKPPLSIPISGTRDIVDVTGAGDTVVSVATLALVAGAGFDEAARLANVAAGIVVMKPGAATANPAELFLACGADPCPDGSAG